MKITKRQLKRIIREEYTRVLAENVMSLVKKYASAGTPQTEQIKQDNGKVINDILGGKWFH